MNIPPFFPWFLVFHFTVTQLLLYTLSASMLCVAKCNNVNTLLICKQQNLHSYQCSFTRQHKNRSQNFRSVEQPQTTIFFKNILEVVFFSLVDTFERVCNKKIESRKIRTTLMHTPHPTQTVSGRSVGLLAYRYKNCS